MNSKLGRLLLVLALLAGAACGGGDDDAPEASKADPGTEKTTEPTPDPDEPRDAKKDAPLVVQVASYDMAAGRDQRVLLGLLADGGSGLISFGEVDASFTQVAGANGDELAGPAEPITAKAAFFPVAGQTVGADTTGPRVVEPSEGFGVYAAVVRFPEPGTWQVDVDALVGGATREASQTFTVRDRPLVPAPGDQALRTENLLPGDPNAPAKAIDSRAGDDGSVPDPKLHSQTIASALDAGKPLLVVVSTPVYCESRFCGPITDVAARLADEHGEAMAFVHLEVWRDFEKQVVNKAAADWILREEAEGFEEPWVFLVGADGKVAERFDNLVSETALAEAVRRVIG